MADQFHSAAWHERRKTYIGGSDAAAVIGASRWGSPLSVYLDKTGQSPERPQTSRMEWGNRLEGAIADWYAEREGVPVRKVGFRRHPVHAFVGGEVDREAVDGAWTVGAGRLRRGVEIKTADHLDESWGEEGSDKVPADYWTQVQHYQMLRGYPVTDLVVLVRGNDPRVFTIPADPAFQAMLLEEERRFWHEHVIPRIPPPPDGSEASREALSVLYPRSNGEEMIATPEMSLLLRQLLELKAEVKHYEGKVLEAENVVKAAMGARSKMVGGDVRASWSEREGNIGWKTVAASMRRQLEEIGQAIRSGDFDAAERYSAVDLDTLEGLYRGDPIRTFRVDAVKREEN